MVPRGKLYLVTTLEEVKDGIDGTGK